MSVGATILLALKTLPDMVNAIKGLNEAVLSLQASIVDQKYESLKREMNATLTRISHAQTNEERQRLVADLTDRISKL